MAVNIPRGQSDEVIDDLARVLTGYEADHPDARIDLYRQNRVSVRLRVIDPGFDGQELSQRSRRVWQYLEKAPDESQSDISQVVLITPDEAPESLGNFEFEHPTPSRL